MALTIAFVATTMTSCFGFEDPTLDGPENTEPEIPQEPLTSGPASVTITGATATTASFDGSITNQEIDLNFLQVTVRYAEVDIFSAMNEELPKVVITRPDIKDNKFDFTLQGLKYNTSYQFCVIVQYQSEVFYSEVKEFKTANVANTLAVKPETITNNSAEIAGRFYGFSDVDWDLLEMGLFYSNDKSLVEKGEGTQIVFDDMAADGSVSVVLDNLYMDGPTYHFCTYVKQGEDYNLGKVITFELVVEAVKKVKKITRTEQIRDRESCWVYEFEYDNNKNAIIGSKCIISEDDDNYGFRFTYDYSTKGKVVVDMYEVDNGMEEFEDTYEVILDPMGNLLTYEYVWEDGWEDHIEYYHYTVNCTYTPDGYLSSWSESDGEDTFGLSFDYSDGRLSGIEVLRIDDDYDEYYMFNDFTSDLEVKNTSVDLNKVLYPYFIENEFAAFSAVKTGTFGKYYFDRMLVEEIYYDDFYVPYFGTTTDPNYRKVETYSAYEYEGLDDWDSFPITSVKCDQEGYPTEFIADIRGCETEVTVTYGAGEVERVDEYNGTTYYKITEIDKQVSKGPVRSMGKGSVVVEYCD